MKRQVQSKDPHQVDSDIRTLVEISRSVGSDDRLVQAGGGNTSVKSADGTRMHIKASGTGLRDMSPDRGYVTMALEPLMELLHDEKPRRMSDAEREPYVLRTMYDAVVGGPDLSARPSCEATLHAMLRRYVVHIHPVAVNGVLCSVEAPQLCEELARRGKFTMVCIPYTNPGHPLAVSCLKAVASYQAAHGQAPEVLFLVNHGLFVTSDSAERAVSLTKAIVDDCEKLYQSRKAKAAATTGQGVADEQLADVTVELRRALVESGSSSRLIQFVADETARRLLARKDAASLLSLNSTPDAIVYCLAHPLILSARPLGKIAKAVKKYIAAHGEAPRTVLVPGQGFLVVGDSMKALKTTTVVYQAELGIKERTLAFGGPKRLTRANVDYINGWEVEHYRRELARAEAGSGGPLTGKVALVTGAGSGLGRGISVGLAAAGAHVVLTDIDLPSAEETAELIRKACSTPRAVAVRTDVTDEQSVAQAFRHAVGTFGGVDVVVAAAGIAPAYPIQDFPVDAFRKTLEINLTGYFLAAREAARWMIRQGTGGSLIFISSKSGIGASRNNAAYNVTKAGELHLMRGLALELGRYGIRSNAICPGNVFEGSKIWNPEYIRQAAKKRGLKPEQVIPYYISLTAMNLEIKQQDIANAAVFLASDQARVISGQSLVVDAGQEFVR
jgi:NAD(P)-dependent dehydrogenase (short-subunit alcohol dehydrogenase family)/rhamnose utilization protein RhaD (predicted bifunctional aldolase and dehydrogenase)